MHLANVFPGMGTEYWQDMIKLGRAGPWLTFDRGPGLSSVFRVDWGKLRTLPRVERVVRSVTATSGNSLALCVVEMHGRLAADGPKLFKPSAAQCLAMERVDVRVPIADYRQPYPALIVELPDDYRHAVAARCSVTAACPRYVFVRHWDAANGGPAFFSFGSIGGDELLYFFQDRHEFPTMEDALRTHATRNAGEEAVSEAMTRVCVNLCLLLTIHGCRRQSSNPRELERLRRRADDASVVQRRTHVEFVTLERDVVVRHEVAPKRAAQGGTHASPGPHWRRGHVRNVPCGPGRREKRLVFVPPVFVNAAKFVGDVGDTRTTYRP